MFAFLVLLYSGFLCSVFYSVFDSVFFCLFLFGFVFLVCWGLVLYVWVMVWMEWNDLNGWTDMWIMG